jgi:hypothetical protein
VDRLEAIPSEYLIKSRLTNENDLKLKSVITNFETDTKVGTPQ